MASKIVIITCLFANTVLLAWASCRHSPNWDEVGHLPAGLSHLEFGNFELYAVNPPLVRTIAALPVYFAEHNTDWTLTSRGLGSRNEFSVGSNFLEANQYRSFWLFTLARWACIPFSWLGALGCYLWARDLYGQRSALAAVVLWSFSPSVLAYGQMITPAVGAAAFGCLANYCFWKWLKWPSWATACLTGVLMGLALLSKSTWLILFAVWPVLWLLCRKRISREQHLGPGWKAELFQLTTAIAIGIYVINLGYLFDGTLNPLGNFDFVSDTLTSDVSSGPQSTNRFRGTVLESLPVPFPRRFVEGIDLQKRDFEIRMWSFLRGEWRKGGWWYFYLYAMLVKMPIGTHLLIAFSLVLYFRRPTADQTILLAVPLVILTLVSSQTGFNHHLRYVFPAFPSIVILASSVFSRCTQRIVRRISFCAVVAGVCSSVFIWSHSRSYFNEAVGGPHNGHFHLGGSTIDTNIDCGQDLLLLQEWVSDAPADEPVNVFFNGVVPAELALSSPPRPNLRIRAARDRLSLKTAPGTYVVSVNLLHSRDESFAHFRGMDPLAYIGYSIHVYRIPSQ